MTNKRKALGRGLEALIPTEQRSEELTSERTSTADGDVLTIPIEAIQPNPQQPRTEFDPQMLQKLADSIGQHGLIQPVVVTQDNGRYLLIAGERRWRAARLAGLTHLPAVVKEVTPQARLELALVENIQRADLNPIEEAMAYQHLLNDFGLTQEHVSQRVGRSRSEVANKLGLLKLPAEIQKAVSNGQLSYGHARTLIGLPTPESQLSLFHQILKHDLTVRQAEEIARKIREGAKPLPKPVFRPAAELEALESAFRDSLGTQIKLAKNKKGAGTLTIHFFSDEELQNLYEVIVNKR